MVYIGCIIWSFSNNYVDVESVCLFNVNVFLIACPFDNMWQKFKRLFMINMTCHIPNWQNIHFAWIISISKSIVYNKDGNHFYYIFILWKTAFNGIILFSKYSSYSFQIRYEIRIWILFNMVVFKHQELSLDRKTKFLQFFTNVTS